MEPAIAMSHEIPEFYCRYFYQKHHKNNEMKTDTCALFTPFINIIKKFSKQISNLHKVVWGGLFIWNENCAQAVSAKPILKEKGKCCKKQLRPVLSKQNASGSLR